MWYELLLYNLKVGAFLAVFYLFFKLLLSRETFHRFNRVVVLGAMFVSFLLPLCVITVERELPVQSVSLPLVQSADPVDTDSCLSFPWQTVLGVLFLAGAVATALWTLWSLSAVLRSIRRGRRERLEEGTVLIRRTEPVTPFSWGRYVVISDRDLAENGPAILAHERAHARLHHSRDVLMMDLAGCLQWFNPAMWLLRRELRAIHEYEADEAVLSCGIDARSYQMLLIKKAVGGRWCSVANSFNHSKLKNRITMMLRKRSSRWVEARALLLLPLVGLALGAFAQTRYVVPEDKVTKENERMVLVGNKFSDSEDSVKPLILVDGQRVLTLDTLCVDRIASVTVLKDSTARAVYGPEAKDGVILVTLKKPGETAPAGETASAAGSSEENHAHAGVASKGVVTQVTTSTASSRSENRTQMIAAKESDANSSTLDSQRPGRVEGDGTSDLETFCKELEPNYVRISRLESENPEPETTEVAEASTAASACNTVVGGRGGMLVVGPEVMSKSRSNGNGSVTVAKGRVTADFSEIEEADYRIELDGKSATMSDLKRIEPGKIRKIEVSYDAEAPDKPGLLQVRTRK